MRTGYRLQQEGQGAVALAGARQASARPVYKRLPEQKRRILLEQQMKSIIALLLFIAGAASANGTLTPDIRISSESLGYNLQYRVYVPEVAGPANNLPVLYITDGPDYVRQGRMQQVLDDLIDSGEIEPIVAVFVDARDPDNLRDNRRNSQFMCNRKYLDFYVKELIPLVEKSWPVGRTRDHRGILGMSYGGTNAACFGLMGYATFTDIGMHSPANHPVEQLLPAYEQMPLLPLKIFLSTGRLNDNTQANRRFRRVLEEKGYPVKYVETREGHSWNNWRPLIDDVLLYFYGTRGD